MERNVTPLLWRMKDIKNMKKIFQKSQEQRRYSDLVGVDFSTTATKVVRLKKTKDEISLMGIDLLPPIDFDAASQRMELPRNMLTNYACLAYSGPSSIVRMINAPLTGEEMMITDSKLKELLNVKSDYRASANLIKKGNGRQDSNFLAAAIPEDDIRFLLSMFPSGPPAPASVEVAGLASIAAFLNAHQDEVENNAVCLIEAGETVSHFAFLNKGAVVLVGKFDVGGARLRERVIEELGVDDELAGTILTDRSINISTTMLDIMTPFLKQLSISKDFIERHQGCRVSKIYVSGGVSMLPHWPEVVNQVLHTEVVHWNPLDNIQCDPELLPSELAGQSTRFAAAIGAAIGGFEES
jgi:Tfp pilus assembly PilM family ATPase